MFNWIKDKKYAAWCFAGFLLLFASFSMNLFGTGWFGSQAVSEVVVTKTAECQKAGQLINYDGLYKKYDYQPFDVFLENGCQNASAKFIPYPVQFALQSRVISAFAPTNPNFQQEYFRTVKLIFAAIMAAVMLVFACAVGKEFGKIAGVVTLLGICMSDWIVAFASDLYWAAFLMFLPLVFSFTAYQWFKKTNRIWQFYAILGIIFWLKFLDGYEQSTTIVISAFLPIMYFELKDKIKWQKLWRPAAYILAAAACGFLLAFYMNVASLKQYYGSWSKSIQMVNERGEDRWNFKKHQESVVSGFKATAPAAFDAINKLTDLNILAEGKGNPIKYMLISFTNYMLIPAVSLPFAFKEPIGSVLQSMIMIIAISAILLAYLRKNNKSNSQLRALKALFIGGILGGFSWLIAFPGHAYPHPFINGIVFYMPLLLFCYIIIGLAVEKRFFKKPRTTHI